MSKIVEIQQQKNRFNEIPLGWLPFFSSDVFIFSFNIFQTYYWSNDTLTFESYRHRHKQ